MRAIRTRALKIIGVGLVITAVWIAIMVALAEQDRRFMGPGLGLPLVPLLVGLVELVSGRHFDELAKSWDSLKGWQRGLLGTVIVAIAIVVFIVIGGTVAMVLAN